MRSVYDLAARQGGYFTTAQAQAQGVSRRSLSYRVDSGDLIRVGHGIYRLVRYPSQPFEDVIVACLWAGADSAASHETALAIYELTDATPLKIHITVPRPFRGRRRGVVIYHAPLEVRERSVRDGIPITTVARTLADVALTSETATVVSAAEQSLSRGLISAPGLKRLAEGDEVLERALVQVSSRAG